MTRHTFGDRPDPDDPDILEIQGVEYPMQPIGMRAMRRMLDINAQVQAAANGATPDAGIDAQESMDAAIDLIIASVQPDHRDRLREHIEESVPPAMIANITQTLTGDLGGDLGPTPPAWSSDGSSPAGLPSTAGASPEA